jgi:endonuclease YncB( thermonuclease family)
MIKESIPLLIFALFLYFVLSKAQWRSPISTGLTGNHRSEPELTGQKQERFRQFKAKVLWYEISDGDTIKVKVDNPQIMWLYPSGFAIRVFGINTAEIHAKKGLGYFANRSQNNEL